ncbi:MAG TPA: metallophosphoesterase family protein [Thermoleophilaceae bacterium]|nr:metallophosphoesterase family protein [Thermoleophilaceae bacterium]
MKLLAFSDVHCDLGAIDSLVEQARSADVVAGVGDFASVHEGLLETVGPLAAIEAPVLLVPGNNETADALRSATAGWDGVTVLHGESATVDGIDFFGIGGGIPTTPWDWSFDLTEDEATNMLRPLPDNAVLLSHSPPKGHVDKDLGSTAVLEAAQRSDARAVLCGHIHEQWTNESRIGDTFVRNLGPDGYVLEL